MQYRKIADEAGLVTYALIFDEGDEAFAELGRFARETGVNGASLSGVGAGSKAVVGWFDFDRKQYDRIPIAEQVEVLSLLGDVATTEDGKPQVHAHVVLGRRDGTTRGGHLLELHVKPTLEVIVTETPTHLRKRSLPDVPIATIRLPESG
ncbi:MAG TPA: PPC domain-containing DNA-binding protein [Candidatus Limnocylindria bacterium]|jgi:predicted DNA-binding protein with PD1-like motif|nr:PPC domain-containing DNA-binding protein [Candidatus Limnocylindria bacterium]